MKGLLLSVDYNTGDRANGQLNIEDIKAGGLKCPAGPLHQRLDTEEHGNFEIRIVTDERDISIYSGRIRTADGKIYINIIDIPDTSKITDVEGAIPLFNEHEINKAVELGLEPKYYPAFALNEIEKWLIDNKKMTKEIEFSRKNPQKFMKLAYRIGCPYIREEKPPKI